MYDYLIVGAGLFGSICARELTNAGKKVLVIDNVIILEVIVIHQTKVVLTFMFMVLIYFILIINKYGTI